MKNKVTVSRAPRLGLVKYKDYTVLSNVSKYLIEADGTVAVVNNEGNAIYIEARRMHSHLWGTYDMVCPMDNFEDVAKWVANGRKLEDLCSHSEELVDYDSLSPGQYFTNGEHVYMKIYGSFVGICDKAPGLIPKTQVWPLGAGDTITIEITE